MAVVVSDPPYKVPMIDSKGYLSPAWVAWFRSLLIRVGGSIAPSNAELAATPLGTLPVDVANLQLLTTSQGVLINQLENGLNQGPVL